MRFLDMCGSRYRDGQSFSVRGSWLAADVLEGNVMSRKQQDLHPAQPMCADAQHPVNTQHIILLKSVL
jgi:hypothetical protein